VGFTDLKHRRERRLEQKISLQAKKDAFEQMTVLKNSSVIELF
jgi:hypothetical protein